MGTIAHILLRALQVIVGFVVVGIYARGLHEARKSNRDGIPPRVYAEVVASLSILTAIVYLLPVPMKRLLYIWDWLMFILWTALFGLFGKMYIHKSCVNDNRCSEMKTAVWFDLAGMLLWLISAVFGTVAFLRERHSRSVFTGRAVVV